MLLGVSDGKLETSVTPWKVSWCVPNNSPPLRAMPCCSLCVCAAPMRGLLPSAAAAKSGSGRCTTGPTVPVLADAIEGGGTLRLGGEGGYGARAAAPECLRSCL